MSRASIKRILPILAGLGIVSASATSVVSCTAPIYAAGKDGQRVLVVTDGGHINDKSFNQDAYIGVKNFVADAYVETHKVVQEDGTVKEETVKVPKLDKNNKPVTGKDGRPVMVDKRLDGKNNYVEAGGTDTTSIVNGYGLAVSKKANVIVTPGFAHVNTLGMALPFLHKHNVNVVLVDGFLADPNVISIQFNSQLSGVMAGFDSSYLMGTTRDENGNLKYDTNGDNKIKIGAFAGASNKYGVDNYMWGLLVGMEIYNQIAEQHNKANPNDKDKWTIVETANNSVTKDGKSSNNTGKISDVRVSGDTDSNWYTNSFALGDATKTGILGTIINSNGADLVFPVAGPQIQDVLSFKRQKGRAPYVIGVDVDQAAEFTDDAKAGRFITSAIKNIDTAVPEALYRASNGANNSGNTLKDFGTIDKDHKINYGNFDTDDHWLGTQVDPFVNWSIDFTNSNAPLGGKYELKQNYIKLFDENNLMKPADKNSGMDMINTYFRSLGGKNPHAVDYMMGDTIIKIADDIIAAYGKEMNHGVYDISKPVAPKANDKAGDK